MNGTHFYTLDQKLHFGKWKGRTVRELVEGSEASYVEWMLGNEVIWLDPFEEKELNELLASAARRVETDWEDWDDDLPL